MDFKDLILECTLSEVARLNGKPTTVSPLNPQIILRNTNKEFLLDQFSFAKRNAESLTNDLLEDPTITEIRDDDDTDNLKAELEKNLQIENIVSINILMKNVNHLLKGKVFLARVITKPTSWNSTAFFLGEDPEGERGVRMIMEHNPEPGFSKGNIVAVLNPYFKTTPDGGIELKSCTKGENEFVILTSEQLNEKLPSIKWLSHEEFQQKPIKTKRNLDSQNVTQLRKDGNKHFVAGNYEEAIETYTDGLTLCSDDEELLANRSLCYLKLEQFKFALKDALSCLKKNPLHLKAIYRGAQAHLGLKEYEKAKSLLNSKLKLDGIPKKDLNKLLLRTEELIAQKVKGHYDMKLLYKNMEKDFNQEIADYVGPVKITNVGVKGRGLTANRDIKPGELVLCSQAFAVHISPPEEDYFESVSNLIKKIINRLKKNPELGKELYKLSAGKEMGYLDPKDPRATKIDVNRIRGILKVNFFRQQIRNGSECSGLWIFPAYINNDCHDSNCSNIMFGNIRQIRCMKPIKKGEEILISYRTVAFPLWQQSISDPEFGMICQCNLCKYESGEPRLNRITRDAAIKAFTDNDLRHPNEVLDIIDKIQSCSSTSPYLQHYLAWPLFNLANHYFFGKDYVRAREKYVDFINSWPNCGGDVTLMLCLSSERIYKSYITLFDFENAKKWKDLCLEYVKLRYGLCDDEFLETIYPGITLSFKYVN